MLCRNGVAHEAATLAATAGYAPRMAIEHPEGQELNDGEIAVPRTAATMIVMRAGDDGPEVLLVQRNPAQRFMGGLWVFPGGAHSEGDADLLATALRELEEEAGLRLDAPDAPLFGRWITPEALKVRFDASFYLAEAPADADAQCDGGECVDLRWMRPADVLDAHRRGEMGLAFPTIRQMQELAEYTSVAHALETVRGRTVEAILPRLTRDGERVEIEIEPA